MKIILIAGVPSSQALPGFLITAPLSVCVPVVIVALAVCIQNQKKQNHIQGVLMPTSLSSIVGVPSSQALPGYLISVHHLCAFQLYLARLLCDGIKKKMDMPRRSNVSRNASTSENMFA